MICSKYSNYIKNMINLNLLNRLRLDILRRKLEKNMNESKNCYISLIKVCSVDAVIKTNATQRIDRSGLVWSLICACMFHSQQCPSPAQHLVTYAFSQQPGH